MIEKHITQLYDELKLSNLPVAQKDGKFQLQITSFQIDVVKLDPGMHITATIAPLPPKDKEDFLLKLMKANFLGQGTGGAVLGLTEDESFLTLSLTLPYEMNYMAFKESVEEFVNYLEFWKNETAKHTAQLEQE